MSLLHSLEYKFNSSRSKTSLFMRSVAHHCVGFPSSGGTICEDANDVAFYGVFYKRHEFLKNLFLCACMIEDVIKEKIVTLDLILTLNHIFRNLNA
jgi:hypothetical protein